MPDNDDPKRRVTHHNGVIRVFDTNGEVATVFEAQPCEAYNGDRDIRCIAWTGDRLIAAVCRELQLFNLDTGYIAKSVPMEGLIDKLRVHHDVVYVSTITSREQRAFSADSLEPLPRGLSKADRQKQDKLRKLCLTADYQAGISFDEENLERFFRELLQGHPMIGWFWNKGQQKRLRKLIDRRCEDVEMRDAYDTVLRGFCAKPAKRQIGASLFMVGPKCNLEEHDIYLNGVEYQSFATPAEDGANWVYEFVEVTFVADGSASKLNLLRHLKADEKSFEALKELDHVVKLRITVPNLAEYSSLKLDRGSQRFLDTIGGVIEFEEFI